MCEYYIKQSSVITNASVTNMQLLPNSDNIRTIHPFSGILILSIVKTTKAYLDRNTLLDRLCLALLFACIVNTYINIVSVIKGSYFECNLHYQTLSNHHSTL